MSQALTVLPVIFWGVIVLSVLVFAHEAGHFLCARISGVRVTEFFLGLPCRFHLSKRSRTRGTEYGITPILLGGYTRICGMSGSGNEYLASILAGVQNMVVLLLRSLRPKLAAHWMRLMKLWPYSLTGLQ